jgi:3-methyl-2-oxobutanoate hydroxymethyltransferase
MRKTDCLAEKKRQGVPIAVLTAYDAPTAGALAAAGVDVLLVGDSVGTNLLGYASERDVTLADMCHHVGAARRGAPKALIIGDLPYRTYETAAMALESARQLVAAGADIVKFEGARPEIAEALAGASFEVCGHIGLEPQHHEDKRLKGRLAEEARRLLEEALALQRAGIGLLILELIPEEVAGSLTEMLKIPTIGIGAGRKTNGQVLVITDMLGFTEKNFRHNKRYQDFGRLMGEAARDYARDVRDGHFPAETNVFHMDTEELAAFEGRAVPSNSS